MMSIQFKLSSLLFCAVALFFQAGCDLCEVPEGKYKYTVTKAEGDCPDDFVMEATEEINKLSVTVKSPDNGCGDLSSSSSYDSKLSSCKVNVKTSGDADEDGVSNFRAVMTISGDECEQSCKHTFDLDAKK